MQRVHGCIQMGRASVLQLVNGNAFGLVCQANRVPPKRARRCHPSSANMAPTSTISCKNYPIKSVVQIHCNSQIHVLRASICSSAEPTTALMNSAAPPQLGLFLKFSNAFFSILFFEKECMMFITISDRMNLLPVDGGGRLL